MAAKVLAVLTWLAVLCQVRGEILFDIGTSLRSHSGDTTSEEYSPNASARRFCYADSEIYFATSTEIRRVTGVSSSELVVEEDFTIDSLSCACNIMAYSYRDTGSGCTYLVFGNIDELDTICIRKELDCGAGSVFSSAVSVEGDEEAVIAVTRRTLFVTGFDFLGDDIIQNTFGSTLALQPRCIAGYKDGDDWHVWISTDVDSDIIELVYDGTSTTSMTRSLQTSSGLLAEVACLDICGDIIYFLMEADDSDMWQIKSYDIDDVTVETPSDDGSVEVGPFSADIDDEVNGLVVYDSDCSLSCDSECDCSGDCGFCVDTVSVCQCENSNTDCCEYKNSDLEDECAAVEPTVDAYCAIRNPLGERRRPLNGNPIHIVGVSSVAATITVDRRTAKTGRWVGLPSKNDYGPVNGVGGLWYNGFRTVIQGSSRGKRFGVFEAEIDPDEAGVDTEYINCIVTERSGFYNKFYTYTRVVGEDVTLVASANDRVTMRMSQMRWWFQRIDQETNMPTGDKRRLTEGCQGSLTCTIEDLEKTDEGIYEVARLNIPSTNRKRRTWHPIFFLYVRECGRNEFGATCNRDCDPECEYGECDNSGTCVCYPGFTGEDCASVCSVGFVGQDCGIECNELFPGNGNCWDILFCQPNKMGCRCSTGRRPPSCQEECEDGHWGPDCEEECPGGADDCDPRDGST